MAASRYEFLFSCSTWYLTHSLCSLVKIIFIVELNTEEKYHIISVHPWIKIIFMFPQTDVLCFSFSMVILLNLFATRFPMDIRRDEAFVSKNIAVYVVRISQSDVVGKMCYATTDKHSRLEDIDCLPCRYNTSCEKQMVGMILASLVK